MSRRTTEKVSSQQQHPTETHPSLPSSRPTPFVSQPTTATTRSVRRGTPNIYQQQPGAYPVEGPDYEDRRGRDDDETVQIGGDDPTTMTTTALVEEPPPAPLDATVVDESNDEPQDSVALPPLVEAQVDKSCTIRDRRLQCAFLALFVVIGAVLGIVFGVVLNDGNGVPTSPPVESAPTVSPSPSASPTVLVWEDAGGVDDTGFVGNTLAASPEGTRFAILNTAAILRTRRKLQSMAVQVYEEENGAWTLLGDAIGLNAASISLSRERIAIGGVGSDIGVSVYELQSNAWSPVGTALDVEGWTVALSLDGNVLAVEAANLVQVYELNDDNDWTPKGDSISTTFVRVNQGNEHSRLALSNDGNVMIVGLTVYQYDETLNKWLGSKVQIDSDAPDTPVSISGDGLIVAVGQPQSNINGPDSGRVRTFRFDGSEWSQYGDDIIGDGQVQGFWGWSHSLSNDGSRIAIMNNGSQKRANVFRLQESRWIRLLDEVPMAVSDGAISISDDGSRVLVGGEGAVRAYDITGV